MTETSTSERNLQSKILGKLNKIPQVWAVKYPGGTFGKNGTPDILLSVNGIFMALEVKTPKGKESLIQQHTRNQILKSGGISKIVRSVEDAVAAVENVLMMERWNDSEQRTETRKTTRE